MPSEQALDELATLLGDFLLLSYKPWDIPSDEALGKTAALLGAISPPSHEPFRSVWGPGDEPLTRIEKQDGLSHWRFSDAAAAICFIDSLPSSLRIFLRRLILREDYPSALEPECHGRGLAHLCAENSWLQIERRVDMWKCLYPGAASRYSNPTHATYTYNSEHGTLEARQVAAWLFEAEALPRAITAVIHGDKVYSKTCTKLFDSVVAKASFQEAMELCFERCHFPTQMDHAQHRRCYGTLDMADCWLKWRVVARDFIAHDFPARVRDLIHNSNKGADNKGSSRGAIVRCNFRLDDMWDTRLIAKARRGFSGEDWNNQAPGDNDMPFRTERWAACSAIMWEEWPRPNALDLIRETISSEQVGDWKSPRFGRCRKRFACELPAFAKHTEDDDDDGDGASEADKAC